MVRSRTHRATTPGSSRCPTRTADGDWSDRVIRPVRLPATVPQVEYGIYERTYGPFVAEPAIGDRDGPRSVLLPVLERDGVIRIYRLTDAQADGDLTAPGEVELVYEGLTSSEAAGLGMAPPISRARRGPARRPADRRDRRRRPVARQPRLAHHPRRRRGRRARAAHLGGRRGGRPRGPHLRRHAGAR